MKARRLDKREFAWAIERGLGRALLHVREYGDEGIENELLNACLRNLVFDRQFEDGRSWWLMQMLPHTRRVQFYADSIKQALVTEDEPTDFNQLAFLAVNLFDQGFSDFKDVLTGLGPRNLNDEGLRVHAVALVQLNGFAGLEAGIILMQENSADVWEKCSFYESALEELDDTTVTQFLEKEAKDNLLIAEFLKEIHEEKKEREEKYIPPEPSTLLQVLEAVQNEPTTRRAASPYRSFGQHATEEDLVIIAGRLENENDPARQYSYLSVFGGRALPIVSATVLELLSAQDKDVRRAARNALRLVRSAAVRNLALKMIGKEDDESITFGLNLLELNFQSEDSELILRSLQKVEDRNFLHWSGMAVRKMAENSQDPLALSDCLIRLCEFDPCGICRGSALKKLIKCGRAPDELVHEAQWDANRRNRIMARGAVETRDSKKTAVII